ncbi:MAG: beta-ketoacyl-[acyl-carrier-protein] synthase family protein [Bacteroidetes bacterium]|nr:MAG: beta-ketoacyl-[acyl-carrier-protein] synthase family protein [Bacteroidota bacterium]
MSDIVITGIGAISAIGYSANEMLSSLKESRHGIAPISILNTTLSATYLAGEVKLRNEELQSLSGIEGVQSRTSLLASVAVKEAIDSANISGVLLQNTGIISSTTVGGMDHTEAYYHDFKKGKNTNFAKLHPSGQHTNQLAKHFRINAHISTVSTACSSASNAMIIGARLIKSKQLDRVIVGGADALAKFTLNGFKSLMILSDEHCKPFDANRKGLNLGEAAAYVVIESKEVALKRGAKILANLEAYANVNEAYHQTASSPNGDGAFEAMSRTLQMANVDASQIDYINAHGTGTDNNDSSESMAINRLFQAYGTPFSSTKAFTGHTLAAAGGVEAVISVLCLNNGFIPANLNFKEKIEAANLTPITKVQTEVKNLNYILSNSFGFGGNNTSLLFSKYKTES